MKVNRTIIGVLFALAVAGCVVAAQNSPTQAGQTQAGAAPQEDPNPPKVIVKVKHTEAEWKKLLSQNQFAVLRDSETEQAFTGKYWDNHAKGDYYCAGCGLKLFTSKTKFESGTGWPSFYQPVAKNVVEEVKDTSNGMIRTEVRCARCGGHLGHVFDDGPEPTGLRFCMNSAALKFVKAK